MKYKTLISNYFFIKFLYKSGTRIIPKIINFIIRIRFYNYFIGNSKIILSYNSHTIDDINFLNNTVIDPNVLEGFQKEDVKALIQYFRLKILYS